MLELTLTSGVTGVIAKAAEKAAPQEACGLLLGRGACISEVRETVNVADEPERHFEIDPVALIAAHKDARAGGPQIIGYFHSHPKGPALPSATDSAMAAPDGRVWAIVGESGDIGWFISGSDGFTAISPRIDASSG
ncbi:M67 family metallopeptidase [Croceicoccus mobilis]|uniref:Mov34/MPN/PAD-1 n=1 Tax=Croceicoccus mobilis TaxID=1703339 RepID=A0A916Z5J9_9SPHN|nr:M67 family metallopeptidase [Croceicoccus mobilis]GGD77818.1 Mov34/MPN/PAD-1 [Croceicoccus mobilis]